MAPFTTERLHVASSALRSFHNTREDPMRDPQALIGTEQLAAILDQPNLRIYDCTTYLELAPPGSDEPYVAVPGRQSFEQAHIPGADFLDLQGEFSDPATKRRFMMPATAQLATAFGRHGLGDGTRVVLYSIGTLMWATRFWWMLRSLGFDNAAVLDGGLDTWRAEGRPLQSGPPQGYPAATFTAKPRSGFFTDSSAVKAALGRPDHVIVNALGPQFYKGLEPSRYGRPGRIPGSVNVPAALLVQPTKQLIAPAEAETRFAAQGITPDKQVIAYCGGGISATVDLFLLHQLGYDKLTLYDGSMGEWAKDDSLPIETG
jgi:thiosulfate/3-mercaptopyruvate sulfurtransferase